MLFALHALLVLLLVACAPLAPDARTPVTVKIFAFNDFHGHLAPPPGGVMVPDPDAREGGKLVPAGGVEHLATLLGTLRKDHPHHAVVSAGDLIGATPLMSSIYNDEPTIEVMNRLGLDFNGVGNHEFDRGTAELLRLQNGGCAPDGCKSGVEISCSGDGAPVSEAGTSVDIETRPSGSMTSATERPTNSILRGTICPVRSDNPSKLISAWGEAITVRPPSSRMTRPLTESASPSENSLIWAEDIRTENPAGRRPCSPSAIWRVSAS